MKPGAAYYRGGARIVLDGIPCRVARKPSARNLADMRAHERDSGLDIYSRKERAEMRAAEAQQAFRIYADALGISEPEAREKVAAHWRYKIENPMLDLSWEYDL